MPGPGARVCLGQGMSCFFFLPCRVWKPGPGPGRLLQGSSGPPAPPPLSPTNHAEATASTGSCSPSACVAWFITQGAQTHMSRELPILLCSVDVLPHGQLLATGARCPIKYRTLGYI